MNVFNVIGKIFTSPSEFFKKVGSGKSDLGFAFGYFALLSLVQTILGSLLSLLVVFPLLETLIPGYSRGNILYLLLFIFLGYILTLGLGFVFAGLAHLWILIFGGKNNYVKTYELGAYAGTPSMLLGWVPLIGGTVGFVWSLVLLIIGTQQVHGISKTKSILMWVIPIVLLTLIFVLVLISSLVLILKTFGSL